MNCPKCQGGSYLADEDVSKILENTTPMKILIKQTFVCRACGDRFSRIVVDDVDGLKKDMNVITENVQTTSYMSPGSHAGAHSPDPAAAGIQFLDSI